METTVSPYFTLTNKIESKVDSTIKYIYRNDKNIVEFSYIDNGTGKDIICVPCQTMCSLGCKLCHLTDKIGKMPTTNLYWTFISDSINAIIEDLSLGDRPLLISFMGAGEPLLNTHEVICTMVHLKTKYENIRFGLATMLPKARWVKFMEFTNDIMRNKLNVKIHLSLHHSNQTDRNEWMPNALNIKSSIAALDFYNKITGNPIEVHYTLMKGVNDSKTDLRELGTILSALNRDQFTLKFMRYSEKDSLDTEMVTLEEVAKIVEFCKVNFGLNTEYYEPPGMDIGSSCGMFLTDI